MKLTVAVASLALASVALLEGATAESSAGQCLAAVSTYAASSGQNGYDNNGNEWGDQAAYYTQNSNYNAEDAAEEAETAITYNMQSLAEALGLNDQEGDGANNVYDDEGYLMAYDAELAESMGFDEDNEEDSATFAAFYKLTYELITNSANYECVDNQDNQEDADEDEEEDIIESILQNCQDLYEEAGIDIDDIDDGSEFYRILASMCYDVSHYFAFSNLTSFICSYSNFYLNSIHVPQTMRLRTFPSTFAWSTPLPAAILSFRMATTSRASPISSNYSALTRTRSRTTMPRPSCSSWPSRPMTLPRTS